jgi:hypothetical protein
MSLLLTIFGSILIDTLSNEVILETKAATSAALSSGKKRQMAFATTAEIAPAGKNPPGHASARFRA